MYVQFFQGSDLPEPTDIFLVCTFSNLSNKSLDNLRSSKNQNKNRWGANFWFKEFEFNVLAQNLRCPISVEVKVAASALPLT